MSEPKNPRRRTVLRGMAVTAAALLGLRVALPRLVRVGPIGDYDDETAAFVKRCYEGLDTSRIVDVHTHVVGLGYDDSGCWVNPALRSVWHPVRNLQFDMYLAGAGIDDDETADRRYLERLLELHRHANPAGRITLFAFDYHVNEDGSVAREKSTFFTPNEYVLRLAREHPDVIPCASVHPYRLDALDRLEAAIEAGAQAVKWLPNAMGIDPASPRCDAYYEILARRGIPLISHGGHESAVDAAELQEFGNPLRMRRPLDAGVRVCLAHCGSLGQCLDFDLPELSRGSAEAFDLFKRLAVEPRAADLLFADTSAITFVNRAGEVLPSVLSDAQLQARLVHGTDYPVIGVDPVLSTRLLVWRDLLDQASARLCEKVFDVNPLQFDFVVKRSLRVIEGDEQRGFGDSVFESARLFDTA